MILGGLDPIRWDIKEDEVPQRWLYTDLNGEIHEVSLWEWPLVVSDPQPSASKKIET